MWRGVGCRQPWQWVRGRLCLHCSGLAGAGTHCWEGQEMGTILAQIQLLDSSGVYPGAHVMITWSGMLGRQSDRGETGGRPGRHTDRIHWSKEHRALFSGCLYVCVWCWQRPINIGFAYNDNIYCVYLPIVMLNTISLISQIAFYLLLYIEKIALAMYTFSNLMHAHSKMPSFGKFILTSYLHNISPQMFKSELLIQSLESLPFKWLKF